MAMEAENGRPVAAGVAQSRPASSGQSAPSSQPGPLAESDYVLIRQAAGRRKAIRNASRTAATSATITLSLGVLALLTLPLWPSWQAALIAVGLCVIGAVEYLGRRRLRQGDPAAAGILGKNQIAFLCLIIVYCVYNMATFSTEKARAEALSPEVRAQLKALPGIDEMIERWAPLVTYGFYGLVIGLSVACQGGMALYYFSRRRHVLGYNSQTPQWVRRVLAESGA